MRRQLIALSLAACGSGGSPSTDAGASDAAVDAAPLPMCDGVVLSPPQGFDFIDHIPASEDFVFDAAGYLVGVSLETGALIRTTYAAAPPETIAPDVSDFGRGTRILAGGDVVVADPRSGTILRFAANGSSTPIASLNDPNGIAVGDDGMIYVTSGAGRVVRIDPDSGAIADIHTAAGLTFDGIAFSPDFRTLYFNQESGQISRVAIDAGGAAGPVEPFAQIVPEFLLDGMTTDVCGNLYVIEMSGVVWQVTPAGDATMWLDVRGDNPFVPALNFGSGRGGWSDTSIYVMSFNGGVYEADLGVAGRLDPHLR